MSILLRIVVGISSVLVGAATAEAQVDCSSFGRFGIYDYRSEATDATRASSYRRLYCQQNFESAQRARDFNASLGATLPLDGVPVPFDLDIQQSDSDFQSSSSEFCDDTSYAQDDRVVTESFVRAINPAIIALMQRCTELNASGLHAWLIQHSDPESFEFRAIFRPTGVTQEARVLDFIPENALCRAKPSIITSAGFGTRCTRIDLLKSTVITFNTSEKNHWQGPNELAPHVPKSDVVVLTSYVRLDELPIIGGTLPTTVGGMGALSNAQRRDGTPFTWGISMDSQTSGPGTVEYSFGGQRFTFLKFGGLSQLIDSCHNSTLGSVQLVIQGRLPNDKLVPLHAATVAGSGWQAFPDIKIPKLKSLLLTADHAGDRHCDSLALITPILQLN
ncbi:hypothetical protein [Mesorhizobium sp. ISC15]|uniref:hypothetical protein n=1 Tax=Mesorhizobium sp. ISC15 TaxID=3076429 RepID=UPI00301C37AF